ncbi:MAG: hypothetical protein IJU54_00390 [Alphaproteobacteria bacterium]|nr:hypothetical protein [Alphaproteobacteria bacterium]
MAFEDNSEVSKTVFHYFRQMCANVDGIVTGNKIMDKRYLLILFSQCINNLEDIKTNNQLSQYQVKAIDKIIKICYKVGSKLVEDEQ